MWVGCGLWVWVWDMGVGGTYRGVMLTDGGIYDADVGLYFTGFGYALETRSESANDQGLDRSPKKDTVVRHTHSK